MKLISIIIFFSLAAGCGMLQPMPSLGNSLPSLSSLPDTASSAQGFEMLPWLGGVAILGGLALLVISGGRKGWYPLLIGIGLILLNWIVLTYAHALFIPVVVATGSLTLAVGYKVVAAILNKEN
jgi:hypothetical protein